MSELLREVMDWLYITRRRALEMGFTHEGWHMGVPVWCEFDGPEGMEVAAKCGALEWVIDFGCTMVQFANSYREPGDEIQFAFLLSEIERP